MGCGNVVEDAEQPQAAIVEVGAGRVRARAVDLGAWPILARQKSFGQPEVRDTRHLFAAAQIGQRPFVVAPVHEVVVRLHRDVSGKPLAIGDLERLGEPWRRVVRGGNVPNLAFFDERIERAQRLFQRRVGIVRMRVVQIDAIDAQPTKRPSAAARMVLGRSPSRPGPLPTLVATIVRPRVPREAIQRPIIVSDSPPA